MPPTPPAPPVSHLLRHLLDVPGWAVVLAVGLLVFVEDALFVGFVLPGETAAVLGGVAAKLGHVPLWMVVLTVVVAAIVGDSVGYEVGRHLGPRVLQVRALDRHRPRLDAARERLASRGGMAVFLGRWVAFFRAVMPALAGSARMPYGTFLLYNASGGIVWGLTVVLAGYAAGASYARVERALGPGVAVVAAGLVLLALLVWRLRRRRLERTREQEGTAS